MPRPTPTLPPEELELCREVARRCPAMALGRATRSIERVFSSAFATLEIGNRQFSALVVLALIGPCPIRRMATALDLSATTLSRNLARLERDGLVRLERGDDRREHHVSLTTKGRAQLRKALAKWLEAMRELEASLGTLALSELVTSLKSTAEVVEAREIDD